jgi:glycosyltransferase involved in cell wall biosynthesis
VSVVISVKDDVRYLERCLDALAQQTFAPYEVIVVNAGGTDLCAAMATQRGARVVGTHEIGILAGNSTGYDEAQGDIIARLDADSVPGATWVASVCHSFAQHPSAAAITGHGVLMDDDGTARQRRSTLYMYSYFTLMGFALGHPPVFGSTFAMRREVWHRVRGTVCRPHRRVHDDIDLSIHLGKHHTIVVDRELMVPVSSRLRGFDRTVFARQARAFSTIVRHWPRGFPSARHIHRTGSHGGASAPQAA